MILPKTEYDLEEAAAIAGLICRSRASIWCLSVFACAEVVALLTEHHAIVVAVAAALVKRRTLSGTEIDSIIGSASSFGCHRMSA
jgi:hypothetical protein